MRLFRIIPLLFLCVNFFQASAQDNCAGAQALCANNSQTPSTIGASTVGSDPALPCGDGVVQRSVWFTVLGINGGTAVITISNIDNNPGLSISAYTGTCGALVPIAGACSFANGPGGSTFISFPTLAGITYYIMVDGEAGNQEVFTITATTPDDGIMARPSGSFFANPTDGCVPLCIDLQNFIDPHGTPITYQWSLCTLCPFIPSSGSDTTVCFSSTGSPDISLRATNGCGPYTVSVPITIYNMVPVINYSPIISCIGQPIDFAGSVSLLPSTSPPTPLNVTGWWWDFGDPGSGVNNNSTLQNPTHVFVGSPPFTVTLVVDGTCGPDTTTLLVDLLPPPIVTATAGSPACQLAPVSLTSVVDSATAPISYQWSGPGTIACDTCQNTTANGLPPGGPYVFTVTITDANGCTATGTASVFINPLPIANAGSDVTVCRFDTVFLNGTALGGTPPYTYAWSPAFGLNDSTLANPFAIVTIDTTYCLVVTDSFGCASLPDCVDLSVFPIPTISSPPSLCATDPQLGSVTISVSGAGAGSTYNWTVVPPCAVPNVVGNVSSQVFDLSGCGPGSFNFTVIVTDGVTGCIDTLTASYTINPGLSMTLTPPDTICAGGSSTLTATGATTYAWTASPPYSFTDSTLALQNVSPAVTTTFTVLGTTGACTQQLSTSVTVNPSPVAVAAPIPPFCGCTSVSLNGTGSTPGMVYQWSSAGGNTILSPTSLVTSANICSSDVFTLVVTDTTTGCTDTATTSATSIPKPAAIAVVDPDTICDGVPTVVTLDGTGSDTNPGTTYLWTSSPPVPIANDTLLVTTANITTTTTFTLTVTAASGCDSIVTVTVEVFPPPVLTGNPGALCTTDPLLQATLTINGAGPGSTYEWYLSPDYSNIISSNADSSSVTAAFPPVPANYNFIVIVTDGVTGCVDTVFTTIPVVMGVTLSTSNDTSICDGDTAALTASGALNYTWTANPPYTFADSTQANQNVSPPVTTTFTVIGTTGVCSDTATILVTVNPLPPNATISGDTTICEGDTSVIYTISPLADSTVWNVSGGAIVSGQGSDTIIVDWGSAGPGSVSATQYNVFGCPGQITTLNVPINPLPNTSVITGPAIVCEGSSAIYSVTNVAGSTYSWTIVGGTPTTGSGSNINVTWGAAGAGTVTVVETNAVGCSDTAVTLPVVINPIPITPPISGQDTVCANDLAQMYNVTGGAGSTFFWTVAGGTIASGQGNDTIFVDWGSSGTGTITVVETNSLGCPGAPQMLTVTINAIPTASITGVSNDTMCVASSISLSGTATNGTISWTTSGSGTFNDTTIANPTYTSAATDTPTVMLIMRVSNPPCAFAADTILITVLPLPITSPIAGPNPVCANSMGAVYSVTNNPGSFYSWSVNGGTIAGGNGSDSITVDWDSAGSGTVTVIEYNSPGGCTDTVSLNIVINPSPDTISIAGDTVICANSTGQYYITPSTSGSTYTWTVTGGNVVSPGNDTTNIDWTTPGNQTIIVTETNSFGCAGMADTLNVLVHPLPDSVNIMGDDTVCENEVVVYFVDTATVGSTYGWGVTGGTFTQVGDTIIVTWIGPSGTVTVAETDSNGCVGPNAVLPVVVNPQPALPTINNTGPTVCEGDTGLVYDVTPNPGSYYLWTVTNGTITSPSPLDSSESITVTWDTSGAGTGTVTVEEVNSFGCRNSNSISININGQPVAIAAAASSTICANDSVQLNGVAVNGNVVWQTSGTGTFGDSTQAITTYLPGPTDVGTTVLTMIVSNPPCPNDTDTVSITITPAPVVTLSTSNSPVDTVCLGNNITVNATGGGTYFWSTGDTTASIFVSPAATVNYVVTVTNGFGCVTTDTILVTVIQPGIADAGADMTVCNTDTVSLNGISSTLNGIWTTSGNGTFLPNPLTLLAGYIPGSADSIAGTVALILTTTGSQCQNLSDTVIITLDSYVSVDAGLDQTLYAPQTALLNGAVNGATGGVWTTNGTGTFTPGNTTLNATYQPSQQDYRNSGFIYAILTASSACNTAIDTMIIYFPEFTIPNVFTPGTTPGLNDFFEIRGLPARSKLQIFNRWGILVYKSDHYRNNWNAAELEDDTYYYILSTPPPEERSYHGHIRVIKKE